MRWVCFLNCLPSNKHWGWSWNHVSAVHIWPFARGLIEHICKAVFFYLQNTFTVALISNLNPSHFESTNQFARCKGQRDAWCQKLSPLYALPMLDRGCLLWSPQGNCAPLSIISNNIASPSLSDSWLCTAPPSVTIHFILWHDWKAQFWQITDGYAKCDQEMTRLCPLKIHTYICIKNHMWFKFGHHLHSVVYFLSNTCNSPRKSRY